MSKQEDNYNKVISKRSFESESQMIDFYAYNPLEFVRDHIGIGICECGCKEDPQQLEVIEEYRKIIIAKTKKASHTYRTLKKIECERNGEEFLLEIIELTAEEEEYANKLGISIRSSKGTGKTRIAAILLIHFMCCFGIHVLNLMTAPKYDQLEDNLIAAVVQWISHARRVFGNNSWVYQWIDVQKGKIFRKASLDKSEIGKLCVSLARTTKQNASESDQKAALSGFHDKYMIVFADECYGIPDAVFEALRTTLTQEINFAILLGNPTTNLGYANETWEDRPGAKTSPKFWINIQMNTENTTLVTEEYKNAIKEEYQFYPNLLRVYYDGLPPLDEDNSIMSFDKITACMELDVEPEVYVDEPTIMVADIAMGGDTSSVGIKQGCYWHEVVEKLCKNTEENEDFLRKYILLYNPIIVGIDNIGIGKGVYDNLKKEFPDIIKAVCVSNATFDTRYENLRAELWMKAAENINKVSVKLPNIMKLKGELNVIKMLKDQKNQKIQIIDKKAIRKSLKGKSSNLADLIMMSEFFDSRITRDLKNRRDTNDKYKKNDYIDIESWMSA